MSIIASHSPLNISETVIDRGLVPKDHQWWIEPMDWIEQCFTSPCTNTVYRLSGRQFYRSKHPSNSIM